MCDVPATDERVRRLFELLDEDKSGTVECAEIGRVLEHDKEAQELSANFEALHDLAGLAEARQKRHHHHHHHQKNAAARLAAFKKLDANGDGNLYYPGAPQVIGGKTHIPVESLRLKCERPAPDICLFVARSWYRSAVLTNAWRLRQICAMASRITSCSGWPSGTSAAAPCCA